MNSQPTSQQRQVLPRVESGPIPILNFEPARKGKPATHFADLTEAEREATMKELGLPAFRAKQLAQHYFSRLTTSPEEMSNIPASVKERLPEIFPELMVPIRELVADRGRTIKSVLRGFDGAIVETVLMEYPDRATLCISSQAGCGMACPFCATGQQGLTRNLSAAEILEQVRINMRMARDGRLAGGPRRLSNIVFMGMGEPLSNFKQVSIALRTMCAPEPHGFGISARHVTVSTVGMVPLIDKLADLGLPVTLAVSLHAPDDALRDDLIPANSRWKVGELLDAARRYFEKTGRRVSIEYALIKDMNDHEWRAQLLAEELKKRGGTGWVHVNPIPLNPTPGSIWTASEPHTQEVFVATLNNAGISTTLRDTRGSDIDGACGQLAADVKKKPTTASAVQRAPLSRRTHE